MRRRLRSIVAAARGGQGLVPSDRLRELEHVFLLHSLPVDLAPPLEPRHVEHCRVFAGRDRIVDWLPADAVCAEVGVQHGCFSEQILCRTSPARLHLIDVDLSQIDHDRAPHIAAAIDQCVVHMHEARSPDMLGTFPAGYFDWIYIDGDHTYDGVSADIDQAVRVVKPDGLHRLQRLHELLPRSSGLRTASCAP